MSKKYIKKNGHEFYVNDSYSVSGWCDNGFFEDQVNNGRWEEDTFDILDKFSNKDKVYVDVGAWIGPTVLYASPNFSKVLCFEPDPVALKFLRENLSLNSDTMQNIHLVEKGLFTTEGETRFGGTWNLGNSESTFLVNFQFFSENAGDPSQRGDKHSRKSNIITVPTTTLEKALQENSISGDDIGLIKVDIEGGEVFLIPAIASFLMEYKPTLYISLHYCYLSPDQLSTILNILFEIYPSCLVDGKYPVTRAECKTRKLSSLVFRK